MAAGVHRLRPVILTTVTTIGGLLPLFLNLSGGAEFWQPLTGAIVSGLAFATILTLIVIPVFYSLVYNGEFRRSTAPETAPPSPATHAAPDPAKLSQLDRRSLPLNPPGDFSPPVPQGSGGFGGGGSVER